MKHLRKQIAFFITIVMVFQSAYAVNAETLSSDVISDIEMSDDELWMQIYESYTVDPGFVSRYSENADEMNKLIDRAVEIYKRNTSEFPRNSLMRASISLERMRLIKQPDNYLCVPTSALQALYGASLEHKILGATDNDKIYTLAGDMRTSSSTGTDADLACIGINKYIDPSTYTYTYTSKSAIKSVSNLGTYLYWSLLDSRAPILYCYTNSLYYYGGKKQGHAIAVQSCDTSTEKVNLLDCNNNISFYGAHLVSLESAFESLDYNSYNGDKPRWLLHA